MQYLNNTGTGETKLCVRKKGNAVYIVDALGNPLSTEPLCLLVEEYHPWFFDWIQTKFREED